ncbi:MAG: pyridoxamine kinase [Actinomycetes bacterium]|jgi:pyridoxine kinase|nr:pyridoxamine kinase [Actinomycetes bacterium]
MRQRRVLAIHDISGFGRCSLTVALPVLSAAGIECSVLPTAVLSTHTGGFEHFTFRDLTEDLMPMALHWASLGLRFDAIYTGYLGSFEQIKLVREVIALLRTDDTLVVVDPVMGDAGQLYAGFSQDFPAQMRTLCADADLIVPNITEAELLLTAGSEGRTPPEISTDFDTVVPCQSLPRALAAQLGVPAVVLTGVSLAPGDLGALSWEAGEQTESYFAASEVSGMYHGSGDVFSSALVAALVEGLALVAALRVAVHFTVAAIRRSHAAGTDTRYGVNFEAGLSDLRKLIEREQKTGDSY